jgi:hypothetical protein
MIMLPIPRVYVLLYAVKMFLSKNPDDGRIPWSVPHWVASWYESLLLKGTVRRDFNSVF